MITVSYKVLDKNHVEETTKRTWLFFKEDQVITTLYELYEGNWRDSSTGYQATIEKQFILDEQVDNWEYLNRERKA